MCAFRVAATRFVDEVKVVARGDDRIAEERIRKHFTSQNLSTQLRYGATRRGVMQVGLTRFARAHSFNNCP